jgi:O-acetyl-ADP-ribose deacetylase (regulator of RNase III)
MPIACLWRKRWNCSKSEVSATIPPKIKNQIQVVQGDITKLDCDCIVNAANRSLLGGGGVDGAIHRAAGPELLAECRTLHGCRTGEAKITKGYRLRAKYIIHTVGPIYSGTAEDATQLADCYRNSLNLAKEHELHSIAFPAISTGVYGYPLEDATEIAVKTVAQWLEAHADYAMQVIFCCFDARTERVYQARL